MSKRPSRNRENKIVIRFTANTVSPNGALRYLMLNLVERALVNGHRASLDVNGERQKWWDNYQDEAEERHRKWLRAELPKRHNAPPV